MHTSRNIHALTHSLTHSLIHQPARSNDEARYLATQSNMAAKRALRVTEATKKLASDTAIKLHEQGDQIRNAQGSVSQIHLDLKEVRVYVCVCVVCVLCECVRVERAKWRTCEQASEEEHTRGQAKREELSVMMLLFSLSLSLSLVHKLRPVARSKLTLIISLQCPSPSLCRVTVSFGRSVRCLAKLPTQLR
jgi:hypothetical protein